MTETATLSRRATSALLALLDGGYFRHALERNAYTGHDKFHWRLFARNGAKLPGVGVATFREMEAAGQPFRREAQGCTGISTRYYILRCAALAVAVTVAGCASNGARPVTDNQPNYDSLPLDALEIGTDILLLLL